MAMRYYLVIFLILLLLMNIVQYNYVGSDEGKNLSFVFILCIQISCIFYFMNLSYKRRLYDVISMELSMWWTRMKVIIKATVLSVVIKCKRERLKRGEHVQGRNNFVEATKLSIPRVMTDTILFVIVNSILSGRWYSYSYFLKLHINCAKHFWKGEIM